MRIKVARKTDILSSSRDYMEMLVCYWFQCSLLGLYFIARAFNLSADGELTGFSKKFLPSLRKLLIVIYWFATLPKSISLPFLRVSWLVPTMYIYMYCLVIYSRCVQFQVLHRKRREFRVHSRRNRANREHFVKRRSKKDSLTVQGAIFFSDSEGPVFRLSAARMREISSRRSLLFASSCDSPTRDSLPPLHALSRNAEIADVPFHRRRRERNP